MKNKTVLVDVSVTWLSVILFILINRRDKWKQYYIYLNVKKGFVWKLSEMIFFKYDLTIELTRILVCLYICIYIYTSVYIYIYIYKYIKEIFCLLIRF